MAVINLIIFGNVLGEKPIKMTASPSHTSTIHSFCSEPVKVSEYKLCGTSWKLRIKFYP